MNLNNFDNLFHQFVVNSVEFTQSFLEISSICRKEPKSISLLIFDNLFSTLYF